ncbi:hypothetical protein QBC35DRAFT_268687 [Podospora australis]|uniref:Centrosomin N-terminal motif 1 domain-containing protein n=1 Tax=Podospora australis TaxID=1536484 RepID=A0AAN7AHT9_9PEZI|nr:hypothetical protein QBC35DRAFT_268687 [Podospora australis]
MDGQSQLTDRTRAPGRPRAASRSSNSSSSTSQTTSNHSHKLHHSRCGERQRSQLSRQITDTSSPSATPMSSLLQERLERERRVESERASSRAGNDIFRCTVDSRVVRSPSPADGRPVSSQGSDSARKRGVGFKELEQTLSNLHKQNFDLKLELYHRRERQTALEERVEKLETEKADTDEMNDRLLHELQKRDKAVEEAVGMIVVLEARVEQLLREREMVRQVEAAGLPYIDATPKAKTLQPYGTGEAKTLNRMPSFLSEQSEHTENLRNVYLGARVGSMLSLPVPHDATPETQRGSLRPSSPALSMLSESSFVSVYGRNKSPNDISPTDGSPSLDGPARRRMHVLESPTRAGSATPKVRPETARTVSNGHGHFSNITDFLDVDGSPLQRLGQLDTTRRILQDGSRSQTVSNDHTPFARPPTSQGQSRRKQEKREALERVLTQGRPTRDHGLPPTPDTMSTATMRLYKDSDATLCRDRDLSNERSYLALSETTTSQHSVPEEHGTGLLPRVQTTITQPASTTAFDSRKFMSGADSYFDHQTVGSQLERPRSPRREHADSEERSPNCRVVSGTSTVDTWLRESVKPGRDVVLDPRSSISQADPTSKGGRVSPDLFSFPTTTTGWATNAMFGALKGTGYHGAGGQHPSNAPMADALDAIGDSLPAPIFSAGLLTPTLGVSDPAPPPPNRKSSLAAKTGDAFSGNIPPTPPARPLEPVQLKKTTSKAGRARSNSIDVRPPSRQLTELGSKQDRAMTVPPKQVHLPPPPSQQTRHGQDRQSRPLPKPRHYPPTASQGAPVSDGARPRSRGLNLFRRSTGSVDAPVATPSSAPPIETTFTVEKPLMGIPSWGRRSSLVGDERADASATPPPILRNKAPTRKVECDDDGGVELELEPPRNDGAPVSAVPDNVTPVADRSGGAPLSSGSSSSNGGATLVGKRRWLNLARVGSLRNRGA